MKLRTFFVMEISLWKPKILLILISNSWRASFLFTVIVTVILFRGLYPSSLLTIPLNYQINYCFGYALLDGLEVQVSTRIIFV